MRPEKVNSLGYRAEIDGLRAFAVISVVLYHAFPNLLTGGFVGVDVFFVISGFLITSHIFSSLDDGSFSFIKFFSRRIRRIFPALILVVVSFLTFGWFALVSDELQMLGKHAAGGAAFIMNFILVGESGYFDTAADLKPFLHLWSLAVEEQFYIIWPVVLWSAWRLKFNLLGVTLLVAAASYYFNIHFVTSKPTEVFFWPFGRFWELLSGSALAWFMLYKKQSFEVAKMRIGVIIGRMMPFKSSPGPASYAENSMAFGGICLLIFGFVEIDSSMPFPSIFATIPVVAAIAIIGAGEGAWINRIFMMNPVAVWFGMISYPLYLWHWPILSFLQITNGGEVPHRDARMIAVALSVFLAWLTVHLVEKPLRFGRQNAQLKVASLAAAMTIVFLVGLGISRADFSNSHTFANLSIKRPGSEHTDGLSSKWYSGKEGWLFLGDSYDDTVAKLKLSRLPEPEEISQKVQRFERLAQVSETTNTSVALMIGPNKSSIYPEYLPESVEPSMRRYVTYFTTDLEDVPNLTVIDPVEEMLRSKHTSGLLYYRTDTHWNNKGAFLAFSIMAGHMNWPLPSVSFEVGKPRSGDLTVISKLREFPVSAGDNWEVVWGSDPDVRMEKLPNAPENPFGDPRIVTNDAPLTKQTVWVIGDSFTNALAPYFDATFKEVRYLGHWQSELETLPETLANSEEKPDLIIVICVERSF